MNVWAVGTAYAKVLGQQHICWKKTEEAHVAEAESARRKGGGTDREVRRAGHKGLVSYGEDMGFSPQRRWMSWWLSVNICPSWICVTITSTTSYGKNLESGPLRFLGRQGERHLPRGPGQTPASPS